MSILLKLDEAKVEVESLTEEEYWELIRLKKEIDGGLEYFNENASPKTLEKIRKYEDKLNNDIVLKNFEKNSSITNHKNSKNTIKTINSFRDVVFFMNRFLTAVQKNVDISPGRLMALTDGIFGMVMTLLIFSMELPIDSLTSMDFILFSHTFNTSVGITVVSFVLLGSFWIYHHEFLNVSSLNVPYLWLNILFLGAISFIPFTTSSIGNFPHFFQPNVLFGINILTVLLSFIILYKYADHMNFLEKKPSEEEKRYTYNTVYLIIGLTVTVIVMDFLSSHHFMYFYFLIPIISMIRDTMFKLKHSV